MKPISIISQDLFDKVRSRFENLEMGDETGAVTIDPAEAMFFDFDFIIEGNNLGRVSMSLADLGSLKVYYSQGITENQDDPVKQEWFKFLKEMRFFAMRRLLRFDTRDIAKTNLDKNDFQHLATTQPPKEDDMTTMNESRWNGKSTKKTSRAIKGKTEVIVRHHEDMSEMYPGARSQPKKIKAIFVQNSEGERWKCPMNYPALGFAVAQHVDHGGVPHDPAGKAIIKMAEEIHQLHNFHKTIRNSSLNPDATGIKERALGRLNELKHQMECLGGGNGYRSWLGGFQEQMEEALDLDAVTMEQYKQKFTQTTFQEELSEFFPLIHKIMSEENTIDLEDYVQESIDGGMGYYVVDRFSKEPTDGPFNSPEEAEQVNHNGGGIKQYPIDDIGTIKDGQPVTQHFPESIDGGMGYYVVDRFSKEPTDGPFNSPEEAEQVNHNGGGIKQYPIDDIGTIKDGQPVTQHFPKEAFDVPGQRGRMGQSNMGRPDAQFEEWADSVENKELTPDQIGELKQSLVTLKDGKLPFGPDGLAPITFFNDLIEIHPELEAEFKKQFNPKNPEEDSIESTLVPWATENYPNLLTALGIKAVEKSTGGDQETPAPAANENEEMDGPPNKTMPTREAIVKEVAKLVKSRFNEDNPEVGPFNGAPNIALDVKKKCSEMFGDQVGDQCEQLALEFMEKLKQKWDEKHGSVEDDGLARLKELLNNVKAKVEGIGDVTQNGHAPGNNIMSAEEVKKSEIPASQRKEKGGDWKVSTKDLEKENPSSHQRQQDKKTSLGMKEDITDILKLSGLAK